MKTLKFFVVATSLQLNAAYVFSELLRWYGIPKPLPGAWPLVWMLAITALPYFLTRWLVCERN